MKNLFFLIAIMNSIVLSAQEYNTVHNQFRLNLGNKNEVFKIGSEYEYEYKIQIDSIIGKVLLNKANSREWKIGSLEEGFLIVNNVTLSVVKRGLFKRTNFFQTQIIYKHETDLVPITEETGLVESDRNIWLHPPRAHFFKILELAPFPYLKFKESDWRDEIKIGNHWSDERWAEWDGDLKLKLKYTSLGTETVNTQFGELMVYKVYAESTSHIGTSKLDFIFNDKYGILKMNYDILGKYKIQFNLVRKTNL